MANFLTRFGTLRQWHWISSALCLAGMLLFAVTGITLNHAGQIEARPSVHTLEKQMPEALRAQLGAPADALADRGAALAGADGGQAAGLAQPGVE
jgi:hypothetical protein